MDNKILFVVFGNDDTFHKFRDIYINLKEGDPLEIKSMENLREQVSFIMTEPSYEDKTAMILKVKGFDASVVDYVVSELNSMNGLIIKFIVLNESKNGETQKDVIKLVEKIESVSDSGVRKDDTIEEMFDEQQIPFQQINNAYISMEALEYMVDIIKSTYGVEDIADNKIPENVYDTTTSVIIKLLNDIENNE